MKPSRPSAADTAGAHTPMMQQGMCYIWLGDFETGSTAYTYTYTNQISDQ